MAALFVLHIATCRLLIRINVRTPLANNLSSIIAPVIARWLHADKGECNHDDTRAHTGDNVLSWVFKIAVRFYVPKSQARSAYHPSKCTHNDVQLYNIDVSTLKNVCLADWNIRETQPNTLVHRSIENLFDKLNKQRLVVKKSRAVLQTCDSAYYNLSTQEMLHLPLTKSEISTKTQIVTYS